VPLWDTKIFCFLVSPKNLPPPMKKKKIPAISPTKDQLQKQLKLKNAAVTKYKRELKIEAALERVRARTMAMQKSEELAETAYILFQQFKELGQEPDQFTIGIMNEEQSVIEFWHTWMGNQLNAKVKIAIDEPHVGRNLYKAWKNQNKSIVIDISGKALREYNAYRKTRLQEANVDLGSVLDEEERRIINIACFSKGTISISSHKPRPAETIQLLERFAAVFDQTYTRFLDLQKAEAQAREAKIEVALEKVRSRTMAMQHSNELPDAAINLFLQVQVLGIPAWAAGYCIWDEDKQGITFWMSSEGVMQPPIHAPLTEDPSFSHMKEAYERGDAFHMEGVGGEALVTHYKYMRTLPVVGEILDSINAAGHPIPTFQIFHCVYFSQGFLLFTTYETVPEAHDIFKRFGKVFDQTYTRFLDLQKAEAQIREAQIEAALERVRSKTMAMHNSQDVGNTVATMFGELVNLGVESIRCGILIIEENKLMQVWTASTNPTGKVGLIIGRLNMMMHPLWRGLYDAWKNQESVFTYELVGQDLINFFEAVNNSPGYPFKYDIESLPSKQIYTDFFFPEGALFAFTHEPISEETSKLFKRFAGVFGQTYRRYLDLQKAEAQAREATIEASLERVRAHAMAMHNSADLSSTVNIFFKELKTLGITPMRCGVGEMNEITHTSDLVFTTADKQGELYELPGKLKHEGHPVVENIYIYWTLQEEYHPVLRGADINAYYRVIKSQMTLPDFPDYTIHYGNYFYFKEGFFFAWAEKEFTEEAMNIFRKFTSVLSLTYKRYKDLKQAEASAREAQIELGLERVRARAMSMHKSDELLEAGSLLYKELFKLGIPSLTSGYVLMDEDEMMGWNYGVNPTDGSILPQPVGIPHTESQVMQAIKAGWKKQDLFSVIQLDPEETIKHQTYIAEQSIHFPLSTAELIAVSPERLVLQTFNFKQGYLLIVGGEVLPVEKLEMVARFAKVFELTYRRFLDLKKAEAQTREAQIELGLERVRARAMAMQTSEELNALIGTVFNELTRLDLALTRCVIMIYEPATNAARWWMANSEAPETPMNFLVKYHEHAPNLAYFNAWQERTLKWQYILEGTIKKDWDDFLFSETELSLLPEFVIAGMRAPDRVYLNASFNNFGNLTLASLESLSDQHFDILLRFAKVFDLTYTRFNDLQKAEASAREAKIETALERVRSKTMAMHQSKELKEVISVTFEQLKSLNITIDSCIITLFIEGSDDMNNWVASAEQKYPQNILVPYFKHPLFDQIVLAKNKPGSFFTLKLSQKENQIFYKHILENSEFGKIINEDRRRLVMNADSNIMSFANFQHTGLRVGNFRNHTYTQEENITILRFANVFEQTYTRFLDLQKAEAQSREAQIEVSLERVRSKAMAMQKSEDLANAVAIVFEELAKLNLGMLRCGIGILNKEKRNADVWTTTISDNDTVVQVSGDESMDIHPLLQGAFDAWLNQEDHSYVLIGEDLNNYYKAIAGTNFKLPDSQSLVTGAEGIRQYYYSAVFSSGAVFAFRETEFPEEAKMVLKRFADVFNITYTRFNDLKQAEAQAREAKIEASLEKVRGKAMAMHSSEDLTATVRAFYHELETFSLTPRRCGVGLVDKETHIAELSAMATTDQGESIEIIGTLKLEGHPVLEGIYDNWSMQQEYHPVLRGSEIKDYYKLIRPQINYPEFADDIAQFGYFFFFTEGGVYAWTEKELEEEELKIYRRFTSVLSLTYKRYKDLKDAEAQARESHIQLALERVRARTMAMQRSDELVETSQLLFEEFYKLNLVSLGDYPDRAFIGIPNKSHDKVAFWSTDLKGTGINYKFEGNIVEPYLFNRTIQAWKKEEKSILIDLDGMELSSFLDYLKSIGFPVDEKHYHRRRLHYFAFFSKGLIGISSASQLPPETFPLLERFAGVFDLTYTRFLDLQKAEAQVRESKIELALERVRARTMAMQRSEELADAAEVLFKQFAELGNEPDRISIGIIDETSGFTDVWATDQAGSQLRVRFKARNDEKTTIHKMVADWKAGNKSTIIDLQEEDLKEWIRYLRGELGMAIRDEHFNNRRLHQVSFFSQGWLNITTLEPVPDEMLSLLDRFAAVFNLTFTRFLDLKKAEAQTRQAKIEAAMEKVRSRALAMQKPEELKEVAQVLRKEMALLGVEELETCSIYIHDEASGKTNCWYAMKDDKHPEKALVSDYMTIDLNDTWVGRAMLEFFKSNKIQTSILMQGNPRKEWINYCIEKSKLFDDTFYGENIPDRTYHLNKFSNGYLGAASPGDISMESWELLQRATAVFSFAYTRFSDLHQAEAQAREATIEAALEKVRGKAMAMHNSKDLTATASLVFTELRKLGLNLIRCGVSLQSRENRKNLLYSATSGADGDSLSLVGSALLDDHPVLSAIYDNWLRGEDYFPVLKVEEIETYYQKIRSNFLVPDSHAGKEQYGYYLAFSEGSFYGWSEKPFTDSEISILNRFKNIIDLTFRRYIELQKSEANARDAVRQASLDRVRAEIASMRTTADLERITPIMWKELTTLGVPFIRCGVFIMDEEEEQIHTFLSSPDGSAIAAFNTPFDNPGALTEALPHWLKKEIYKTHWDEAQFLEQARNLMEQGAITSPEKYLTEHRPTSLYLHFLPFLQGMLYVGSETPLTEEELHLVQNLADAFSTAYARYEDFNKLESAKVQVEKTLVDLKQAQTQLIQSEKMASLGELTAGIAHEIQNPLNFVNNFSEINKELLDELESERRKPARTTGSDGKLEDRDERAEAEILQTIRENLEKINFHGKRADGIVKSMLQHSRSGDQSGKHKKEPTDINVLADEYLRLAYHGLRAKDKTFNAILKTDFDASIGLIHVIRQDIARAVLNLITNAFYAVNEKDKRKQRARPSDSIVQDGKTGLDGEKGETYSPLVSIVTRKVFDKTEGIRIEITVKDNGPGIPQHVLDKIFQPFFTTKPTGQGTGLGLSLSYDIVKAHGGEIKVKTELGEGTEFIILLPIV